MPARVLLLVSLFLIVACSEQRDTGQTGNTLTLDQILGRDLSPEQVTRNFDPEQVARGQALSKIVQHAMGKMRKVLQTGASLWRMADTRPRHWMEQHMPGTIPRRS